MSDNNCKIKRWDLLKRKLNNIQIEEYESFVAQHPSLVLLDCRKPEERDLIYIPNSLNINYLGDRFLDELDALPNDDVYLVYCNTSRRSIRTCTLMQNGGFERVYHLDGGLRKWVEVQGDKGLQRGGQPTEKAYSNDDKSI